MAVPNPARATRSSATPSAAGISSLTLRPYQLDALSAVEEAEIMTTGLVAVALEPAQVDEPSLQVVANEFSGPRTSAAVPASSAPSETEIAPLQGSQEIMEPPGARPSESRQACLRGKMVTTETASPGFVRFQTRAAKSRTTVVVHVVKSHRINGQPRQKLIAYIGTIPGDDIFLPSARRRFRARAAARLEQFAPEIRQRFEDAIAARIARPPAEQSLAQKIEAARARALARATSRAS
jgi:hypothetical protein